MPDFDSTETRNLLSSARNIVITTHVAPDGDAIGSSLGLAHYLTKAGYNPIVITPDEYPAFLHWLPGSESVIRFDLNAGKSVETVDKADLIFCLDFNSPDRLSKLRSLIEGAKCPKILIDHHQESVQWTDVMIADTRASSTSELVYKLIVSLDGSDLLDSDIGSCLYTGIMTDTGSFKFPSTTSSTLRIAASLMDLGVDTSRIQNLVYDTSSEDRLRLIGYALTEKLVFLAEYNTAIMSLNSEELQRYNYRTGDTEGLVNFPLGIAKVRLSVFISEKKGEVRLSLRSKGNIPVHEVARKHFSGGGHINAAGGISKMSVDETIAQFSKILPEYKEFLCQ